MHVSRYRHVKSNVNRLCPLAGLLAVSAFAADAPVAGLLKTVEARYNRTDTLQVLFHVDYTKAGHTRVSESGMLELRKPGRMRWEYQDPKGKLAVCDGKVMWTYTPADHRAEKQPLRESEDGPWAFLLGKLHFDKEFRNIQGTPEGSDMRITAEPKTDALPYNSVEFVVTPDGRIRQLKVTRFDNLVMGYTFDQEKLGPKLDDKLFQFQIPKGAEVVEAGK